MVQFEKITSQPQFFKQTENKILYSEHHQDVSIEYRSTYTLKYVIQGCKNYSFNNQRIDVRKDQYLMLNNDKVICAEAQKGTKGLSIFLSAPLINEIASIYTEDNYRIQFFEFAQANMNNQVGFWLRKVTQFIDRDPLAFNNLKDELFIALSELIVQQQAGFDQRFAVLNVTKHHTKTKLYKLISMTKEFLNDNISNRITLNVVSKNIGLSKYYLHRIFTQFTGNTPMEYLTTIRLNKAKEKLRFSKDSIFEIAMQCGFDSASYFSNVFKRHTNCSPTRYRSQVCN